MPALHDAVHIETQLLILEKINESLQKCAKNYPLTFHNGPIKKQHHETHMSHMVYDLQLAINHYIAHLNAQKQSGRTTSRLSVFNKFKENVNYSLYKSEHARYMNRSNSIFYPVYSAITSLFRAFFRLLDIAISAIKELLGQNSQVESKMSRHQIFFNRPIDPSQRVAEKQYHALQQELNKAIAELDLLHKETSHTHSFVV